MNNNTSYSISISTYFHRPPKPHPTTITMPSSLAAALAASKANTETKSEKQLEHASAKSSASSLAQYQKKPIAINTQTKHPAGRGQDKQGTRDKAGRGGGKSPQNQSRKQTDHTVAAEEIVFVCDIPSDSEEELELDTLQISDHKSGKRHGGSRNNSNERDRKGRDDRDNRNNHGERLNVNASRRLIGHALGTRLDHPQNSGKESNQSHIDVRARSNPGVMPTPWSKKAQEMKHETSNNSRHGKQTERMSNNASNVRHNRRDITSQPSAKDTQPSNSEVLVAAPKLESAKIKGRWADEDSSDDE
jgi:hypothetical protein